MEAVLFSAAAILWLTVSRLRGRDAYRSTRQEVSDLSNPVATLLIQVGCCNGSWRYKAEGGANIAMEYIGEHIALKGHILRLRKVRRTHTGATAEQETLAQGDSATQLLPHRPLKYATTVMQPLLGPEYVVPGVEIAVPLSYLQQWADRIHELRPLRPSSRAADVVDVLGGVVVLMLDHTKIPSGSSAMTCTASTAFLPARTPPVSFCVELKPKCGVTLPSHAQHPQAGQLACRFCMHQFIKAVDKAWGGVVPSDRRFDPVLLRPHVSPYCPFYLFSGVKSQVESALTALCHTPQNNLRVFVDGQPRYTAAESGQPSASAPPSCSCVSPALCAILTQGDDRWGKESIATAATTTSGGGGDGSGGECAVRRFCAAIATILCVDPIMRVLRAVQARDGQGTEGVWEAYQRIADRLDPTLAGSMLPSGRAALLPKSTLQAYAALGPRVEAALVKGDAATLTAVRDFMVATTAKDCSVMIACSIVDTEADDVGARSNRGSEEVERIAVHELPSSSSSGVCTDVTNNITSSGSHLRYNLGDEHLRRNMGDVQVCGLHLRYSVAIVDLDPKPFARIPHYVNMERELCETYLHQGGADAFAALGKVCAYQLAGHA